MNELLLWIGFCVSAVLFGAGVIFRGEYVEVRRHERKSDRLSAD